MQALQAHLKTGKEIGDFMDPVKIIKEIGIKEGMSVSEFGSGAGFFSILIGQRVGSEGHVYSLDIRESALDSVRSKARSNNLSNIETVHTNLEVVGSSGLPDNSQDMVLLANVLFQSKKKEEIIKEAYRVLKKGGKLVVIEWAKGSGGFGPPDHYRTDDIAMQSLVIEVGFLFEHKLSTGRFHYGLVFKK